MCCAPPKQQGGHWDTMVHKETCSFLQGSIIQCRKRKQPVEATISPSHPLGEGVRRPLLGGGDDEATPWGRGEKAWSQWHRHWESDEKLKQTRPLLMWGWPYYTPRAQWVPSLEGCVVCFSLVHIIWSPDSTSHQSQRQTLGQLKGKLAVRMLLLAISRGFPPTAI